MHDPAFGCAVLLLRPRHESVLERNVFHDGTSESNVFGSMLGPIVEVQEADDIDFEGR